MDIIDLIAALVRADSTHLSPATIASATRRLAAFKEMQESLREALSVIEGLADQQAMSDEWWVESYSRIKSALEEADRCDGRRVEA